MHDTFAHSKHSRSRLVFDPGELNYDFGLDHPFQSRRLVALMDLLESSRLLSSQDEHSRLPLRSATVEELCLIHTPDYVDAVHRLSLPGAESTLADRYAELTYRYGFAEGDTPVFPGMHEAAARIVGGTLVAMSAVMGLLEGGTSVPSVNAHSTFFIPPEDSIMPGRSVLPASVSITMLLWLSRMFCVPLKPKSCILILMRITAMGCSGLFMMNPAS